jgi:hypothetical protein
MSRDSSLDSGKFGPRAQTSVSRSAAFAARNPSWRAPRLRSKASARTSRIRRTSLMLAVIWRVDGYLTVL